MTTAEPPQPAAPAASGPPLVLGGPDQPDPRQALAAVFDPRRWIAPGGGRSLPIIFVLVAMWIGFDVATSGTYLSAQNVTNILVEATWIGVTAMGVVVILLLAEIDLSLGSLVSLCGTGSALIMVEWVPGAPDIVRMLVGVAAALIIGALCGFFQGFWVAVMRVPSFVVTLAGLLAFLGISLLITDSQTVVITSNYFNAFGATGVKAAFNAGNLPTIVGSGKNILHLSVGIIVALVVGVGYFVLLMTRHRDRTANGLPARPVALLVAQALGLTIVAVALADLLDRFFGVPLPVFIMLVLLIIFAYVLGRTRYGRHIYATGGNSEAARRAGIPVQRLRWSAFVISGTLAGAASVIIAARGNSMSTGAIDSSFLLNAIAAAVIGGTSLFGGRGTIWSALLGALVLSSVDYGMGLTLIGASSSGIYYTYIVKGAILLLAVALDTGTQGGGYNMGSLLSRGAPKVAAPGRSNSSGGS